MPSKKSRQMRKPSVPMSNGRVSPSVPVANPERTQWPTSSTNPAAAPAAWPANRALKPTARPAQVNSITNWEEEYRYVFNDLRRIGILAGGIIAVLVGLSFVIK